jgi:hypothetical protein
MENIEIAPGIFFKEDGGNFSLCFQDEKETLVVWDHEEVKNDPQTWLSTLKAVVTATQYGPTVAREWIKKKKAETEVPPGGLFCTMCKQMFIAGPDHPYVFSAKLNGKNFYNFQCSEICNKLRNEQVYRDEMGADFMTLWANKVFKE